MFCPRCGASQPDAAANCGACGASMTDLAAAVAPSSAPLVPAPQQQLAPPLQYGMAPMAPVAPVAPGTGNPLAVAGFICGLLGLTPFWIGCVLCVLAIIFSSIGLSRSGPLGGRGKGLAIAGLVCGIVFLGPASCGI